MMRRLGTAALGKAVLLWVRMTASLREQLAKSRQLRVEAAGQDEVGARW
jgi:hypothetical protein